MLILFSFLLPLHLIIATEFNKTKTYHVLVTGYEPFHNMTTVRASFRLFGKTYRIKNIFFLESIAFSGT